MRNHALSVHELQIIDLIVSIPEPDRPPLFIPNTSGAGDSGPPEKADAARILATILRPFNLLDLESRPDGVAIRARSIGGFYFLRSMAAHMAEKHIVFGDWGRPSDPDGIFAPGCDLNGQHFLYLMERQRGERLPDAAPLRTTRVAQLLITGGSGKSPGSYLMQYSERASQFQLIGGHEMRSDKSVEQTMRREAEEELPNNRFDWGGIDKLIRIAQLQECQLSRTTAVRTRYDLNFFHLQSDRGSLNLRHLDRWITHRELTAGWTTSGDRVANDFFRSLFGKVDVTSLTPSVTRVD